MLLNNKTGAAQSLDDYFRERLTICSEVLQPPPHEDTLWYLGNMLARFGRSDHFFSFDDGSISLRPLALLYNDAREAGSEHERCLLLRHLGDISLFLGALFPESYARRGIRKDYFVGMGGGAYDYLAGNAKKNRHIFSELAQWFTRLLQLISQACCKENLFDATDILNLYQRWQISRDPLAARQLQAVGIVVLDDHLQ